MVPVSSSASSGSSSAAETMTGCDVSQFPGSNVRLVSLTVMSVLAGGVISTLTSPVGSLVSTTS